MKRWLIFLGRGGTVLLSIGFALLLVSLIPRADIISSEGQGRLGPESFLIPFGRVLTPQQGLEVTITADDTITVYILEVSQEIIDAWIIEQPPPGPPRLEDFLEENPDVIGSQKETREGKIDYMPTKVMDVTLALSNLSSEPVNFSFDYLITSEVAPGTKVRNLAQWTIPIGFVLALPWIAQLWKEKTTHPGPYRLRTESS
jgi:hypothetical protein